MPWVNFGNRSESLFMCSNFGQRSGFPHGYDRGTCLGVLSPANGDSVCLCILYVILLTAIEIVARVPHRTWVPRESDSPRSPRSDGSASQKPWAIHINPPASRSSQGSPSLVRHINLAYLPIELKTGWSLVVSIHLLYTLANLAQLVEDFRDESTDWAG